MSRVLRVPLEVRDARSRMIGPRWLGLVIVLGVATAACSSPSDVSTADGPGATSLSGTSSRSGATVSPTVLDADRVFCEALAGWINTANARRPHDDVGYGTIDQPTMQLLVDDFAALIVLAPTDLREDLQLLVDRVVTDQYADDVQSANRRLEDWAVLHCRFSMDGANLPGGPGTTQPGGTVMTTPAPPA